MGLSMTEFVGNRVSNFFEGTGIQITSPFGFEDYRNQIIFELIKAAHDAKSPKYSLRELRGSDADDERMRDVRKLKYAQHYRNLQFQSLRDNFGVTVGELLPDDTDSIEGKIAGHKLTKMQYFELDVMDRYPLFKAIVSKRICSAKKISNEKFLELMAGYETLVSGLLQKLDGSDEDVVFATIALFTLEWKYDIELIYACSAYAESINAADVPKEKLALLCADMCVPDPISRTNIHTESRCVLDRIAFVPDLFESDDEWEPIGDKFYLFFLAHYHIMNEVVRKWDLKEYFAMMTDIPQWADFIRKHYDIRQIYEKKEWTNKKIRYFRNCYSTMIMDMEPPKL